MDVNPAWYPTAVPRHSINPHTVSVKASVLRGGGGNLLICLSRIPYYPAVPLAVIYPSQATNRNLVYELRPGRMFSTAHVIQLLSRHVVRRMCCMCLARLIRLTRNALAGRSSSRYTQGKQLFPLSVTVLPPVEGAGRSCSAAAGF